MHCENTTFVCHTEFNKYMTVEELLQKMSLIISLMLGLKNSYCKKEKNIFMNYLKKM